MSNDAVLMIAASEIRPSCKGEPSLDARIRKAFKAAQDFWMSTDDDIRFRGALGAVLMETPDVDEKARITDSLKALRTLGALLNGVPVDMEAALSQMEGKNLLPLKKMWDEAKAV